MPTNETLDETPKESAPKANASTRKTPEQKIEGLVQKANQIQAKIQRERAKLRGQERKRDTRRKIIAGGNVLTHVTKNPNSDAAKEFWRLMSQSVKRPQDRELFPELAEMDAGEVPGFDSGQAQSG